MRFEFQAGLLIRPVLVPFGATRARRFADLQDQSLHVRLGWLFDDTIDLATVDAVERSRWPLYRGLGCRIGLGGEYGVLVSTRNVVRVRFRKQQAMPLLGRFKFQATSFYLALEEPDRFINEIRRRVLS